MTKQDKIRSEKFGKSLDTLAFPKQNPTPKIIKEHWCKIDRKIQKRNTIRLLSKSIENGTQPRNDQSI